MKSPKPQIASLIHPGELVRSFVLVLVLESGPRGVLECWSVGVLECWSVGVLECWSVGVLRQLGIAPRVRGVESAFPPSLLSSRNYGGQAGHV
jgi:hypothetical protein